jgi:hypothetical protein
VSLFEDVERLLKVGKLRKLDNLPVILGKPSGKAKQRIGET